MTLRYYANGRAMKCDGCDAPVGEKDDRYWDSETKKRYCSKCGNDKGGRPTSTQTTNQPSPSSTDAKCDLCGQNYPAKEGGMFYNAQHEAYRVCSFCQRVILCQAHAKIAGFWVVARRPGSVTEKAAAKEEAERHD
jgi:hypothetical protein